MLRAIAEFLSLTIFITALNLIPVLLMGKL